MTTRQFINREFGQSGRSKTLSSVFKDNDGNIYSYGYHYPLLITINGKNVRNVRGYSNTTARHILWSRDIDAIDIHFNRDFRLGNDAWNMQSAKSGQLSYIDSLQDRLVNHVAKGRRKNTKVYNNMVSELANAMANLKVLEG